MTPFYALVILLNGWTANSSLEGGGSRGNAIHSVSGFTEITRCQKASEAVIKIPAGNARSFCVPYQSEKPGYALVMIAGGWSTTKNEGGGSRGNGVGSISGIETQQECDAHAERIRKGAVNPENIRVFCVPQ